MYYGLVALFWLFAFAAYAQNSPKLKQSDPQDPPKPPIKQEGEDVIIQEKKEKSITAPSIQEAERRIHQIPGGVEIIDSEKYKIGRAQTVNDIFNFSPGVFAQSRFGSEEARLSIRGSGLQRTFHGRGIRLMQDGVPINLADGGFDFQALEPLAARYVEVFRGANAWQFGSTTFGGAINFVSETGHTAPLMQARAEGGSYSFARGQISSGQAIDETDYYVTVTHFSQEGFRDHARQENYRAFANVGWRLDPAVETRFYVTGVQSDSELPGSLFKSEVRHDPDRANPANIAQDQKRDFEYVRLANRTVVRGERQRIEGTFYYSYKHLDHPIFQVIDDLTNDVGVDLIYTNEENLFGRKNIFTAGVVSMYGTNNDRRYQNVNGNRGNRLAYNFQTAAHADLFLVEQHYVTENLALVAGSQFSWALRDTDDEFPIGPDDSQDKEYVSANPKVGARYEFTKTNQVFVNVSRSFEPPTFAEMINNATGVVILVDGQTAWTLEVGTRGRHDILEWDVCAYRSWIDGELLGLTNAAGVGIGTVNADSTIHQGVEFGVSVTILQNVFVAKDDRFVLRTMYTWNDFFFDNDNVFGDNRLAGIPEHIFRAEIMYMHPSGFYMGPNVEWVPSEYPMDHRNSFFVDPYAIMGVKVGYRTGSGFSAFIEGRNLLDERHTATSGVIANANGADTRNFLPGDGISVYVGGEYRR